AEADAYEKPSGTGAHRRPAGQGKLALSAVTHRILLESAPAIPSQHLGHRDVFHSVTVASHADRNGPHFARKYNRAIFFRPAARVALDLADATALERLGARRTTRDHGADRASRHHPAAPTRLPG